MCDVLYGRYLNENIVHFHFLQNCLRPPIHKLLWNSIWTNPVESLFLKKPIPALPWNEVFVADQEIKCLQVRNIYNYAKHKHFGPNFDWEMDIR